ncbi:hypothetical protein ABTE96_21250, partial [Acinetobacter baumannii]
HSPQQAELVVRGRSGATHAVIARFEAIELHDVSYMLLTIREAPDPTRRRPNRESRPFAVAFNGELQERYLEALRIGQLELAIAVAE